MSNVRPGQLAMFKPSSGVNAGCVVLVIHQDHMSLLQAILPGVWWACEALQHIRKFASNSGVEGPPFKPGEVCPIPDAVLMPLHDGDGEDEMLRKAGRPHETPVHLINELAPKRQVEFTR